jgi:hypothetical protein
MDPQRGERLVKRTEVGKGESGEELLLPERASLGEGFFGGAGRSFFYHRES